MARYPSESRQSGTSQFFRSFSSKSQSTRNPAGPRIRHPQVQSAEPVILFVNRDGPFHSKTGIHSQLGRKLDIVLEEDAIVTVAKAAGFNPSFLPE